MGGEVPAHPDFGPAHPLLEFFMNLFITRTPFYQIFFMSHTYVTPISEPVTPSVLVKKKIEKKK